MAGDRVSVSVRDLRLTLLGLEDWIHEVRYELEALPGEREIANIDRAEFPPELIAAGGEDSGSDPRIIDQPSGGPAPRRCVSGVPELSPWQDRGLCKPRIGSGTVVRAVHLVSALGNIEKQVGVCRFILNRLDPTEVIRSDIG